VPFTMSEQLKSAAGANASYLPIDAADHNDIFEVGGETIYARIGSFLAR
jgi:hypothetical protein